MDVRIKFQDGEVHMNLVAEDTKDEALLSAIIDGVRASEWTRPSYGYKDGKITDIYFVGRSPSDTLPQTTE